MKRIFFLCILSLAINIITAQTQQGIVKTRGRMVNGQLVAGQRLTGATITLNIGNPLVSGNQGAFSFNVPSGKNYSLVMAKKQGYTLADPEYTRRSFQYSASNPFYVVLEDETQRQADINAATRKVRRTLTAQLQAREDEIEALKAQNKLTEAEYQKRLQELYDNQSKSEQLVKEMAERYVSTDYDQLDEFNRQVQQYIEEGELQKADSMIRSKGDMAQRVADYQSAVAANKAEREALNQRQHTLDQSESATAKTYEDLSQDLLRSSDIYLQAFQQDSALYCLKVRADLDTTNVEAVWDYADLCYRQRQFEECEKYYFICLRAFTSQNDMFLATIIAGTLGGLYFAMNEYDYSEKYHIIALEFYEELSGMEPDTYRINLAEAQNDLGLLYNSIHDYDKSAKYFKLALENKEILFSQNPNEYRATIARTQNGIGALNHDLRNYANSEKYFILALENFEQLFSQSPDTYRENVAIIQNNLGILYRELHDYAKSEKYLKLSLEKYDHLFNQNPNAYRSGLSSTQLNLGNLYSNIKDYFSSEKYFLSALRNIEELFNQNPDAYRSDLAKTQHNLGVLYRELKDYASSEKYYLSALENTEKLFSKNPDAYREDLASTQSHLGTLYKILKDYASSEKYFLSALEYSEQLFNKNPDVYREELATIQTSLGVVYDKLHDYVNCEKYFKLALENEEQLFNQNPDAYRAELTNTQSLLGMLYFDLHDHANCEKYLKLALENNEQLFNQNPDAYREDLANTQFVLGMLYYDLHDYANCEKYYLSALTKKEHNFNQNPDACRADLARTYSYIMHFYADMNNTEQYDLYQQNALNLYTVLYAAEPDLYKKDIIELQNRSVWRMFGKRDFDEALNLAKQTFAMDDTNNTSKYCLAECYNGKAYEYAAKADFTNAHTTIDLAIALMPTHPNFYDTKGEIFLMQDRNDEALLMWKKVIELNPDFLKDRPNGTSLSNALKKLGLIE